MILKKKEKFIQEGIFSRFKFSFLKSKENLKYKLSNFFQNKDIDSNFFKDLEKQLLLTDVGVITTRKIIANLTKIVDHKHLKDIDVLYDLLKYEMKKILIRIDKPLHIENKSPFIILIVGVNGVGKTTTIAKLANQFKKFGKSVMLAAGDTFRSAAIEQLQVWGYENKIPVIAQHTGADAASVIFDAIKASMVRNVDILIADTAGRLHNNSLLMKELKKIVCVVKKLDRFAPHEVMLIIDASTGQNAINQIELFHKAVELTGITLTKLDSTAKGGIVFSIANKFNIPIRYISTSEHINDLYCFDANDFVETFFTKNH